MPSRTVKAIAEPPSTEIAVRSERREPCLLVIFGASGDLTARKLMPALYHLHRTSSLPGRFVVLGASRTDLTDGVFREKMKEAVGAGDPGEWETFASRMFYHRLAYDDRSSFEALRTRIGELEDRQATGGNRMFYLSVPPSLYAPVAEMLGEVGLVHGSRDVGRWTRLVVEKPFGVDLPSARKLDRKLKRSFKERQIFRIDHYLAKETVQNMLVFRFANSIFEPVWNRRYVDHVRIAATETVGVEHRAGYYEQAGVIRDMFQNHMMQLLALMAMEPPSVFEADRVRDEKAKVFGSLRPFPVDDLQENMVLAQYGPGTRGGVPAVGYRQEPGVDPQSLTPTYAAIKAHVDNWRWQGVPFFLTSGKSLKEKRTEVVIQFKEVPHSMFRQVLGDHISANRLTLGIQPDEVITLTFQTKRPGLDVGLRSVTMFFDYQQGSSGPKLDAYEKLLLDCMQGDHTLFARMDGVEQSWSYLTPILERCESCLERDLLLPTYPAGSSGPREAELLFRGHGGIS